MRMRMHRFTMRCAHSTGSVDRARVLLVGHVGRRGAVGEHLAQAEQHGRFEQPKVLVLLSTADRQLERLRLVNVNVAVLPHSIDELLRAGCARHQQQHDARARPGGQVRGSSCDVLTVDARHDGKPCTRPLELWPQRGQVRREAATERSSHVANRVHYCWPLVIPEPPSRLLRLTTACARRSGTSTAHHPTTMCCCLHLPMDHHVGKQPVRQYWRPGAA
jgi:hypothetical protein